jgi:hypothetical protein
LGYKLYERSSLLYTEDQIKVWSYTGLYPNEFFTETRFYEQRCPGAAGQENILKTELWFK